jgi:hypothetical protein
MGGNLNKPEKLGAFRDQALGLWLIINHEAIYHVRPWRLTREGDLWFTRQKDDGLHLDIMLAQRIYNNSIRPNPVVVKLDAVDPVL